MLCACTMEWRVDGWRRRFCLKNAEKCSCRYTFCAHQPGVDQVKTNQAADMLRVRPAALVALQRRLGISLTTTAAVTPFHKSFARASFSTSPPPKSSPFTPRTSAAAFASERVAAAAAQSAAAAAAPPLRFGSLFCPTRRDAPQDAVIPSHQLLIRGGFIRMVRSA